MALIKDKQKKTYFCRCCFNWNTNVHIGRENHFADTFHKVQAKKWEQDVKLDNVSPLCWKQISWPNKHIAIWPDALRMTQLGSVCHSSFVLGLTWSVGDIGISCISTYMEYYCYGGTEGFQIEGLYISVCCSVFLGFWFLVATRVQWAQHPPHPHRLSTALAHRNEWMKDRRSMTHFCVCVTDWVLCFKSKTETECSAGV